MNLNHNFPHSPRETSRDTKFRVRKKATAVDKKKLGKLMENNSCNVIITAVCDLIILTLQNYACESSTVGVEHF